MTPDQLDRLSKVVAMADVCSRMSGTPMFKDVQRFVNDALGEITRELVDEESKTKNPATPPESNGRRA